MSQHIPEALIQEATNVIINTRDFCGDEMLAVADWWADNYRKEMPWLDHNKLYRIANFRANARWNTYKKHAGVPAKYTW